MVMLCFDSELVIDFRSDSITGEATPSDSARSSVLHGRQIIRKHYSHVR